MDNLKKKCEKCDAPLKRSKFARKELPGGKALNANGCLVCSNSECSNGEKDNSLLD